MYSAAPQVIWFADAQETRIEVAKSSDMNDMKGLRFAAAQESRFKAWVRPAVVDFLMFRNCLYKLRNVEIWAVQKYKGFYLLIARNGVFRLRNCEIWAVLFCKNVGLLMLRILCSGCETLKDGLYCDGVWGDWQPENAIPEYQRIDLIAG